MLDAELLTLGARCYSLRTVVYSVTCTKSRWFADYE
jgi:hypothetical protein